MKSRTKQAMRVMGWSVLTTLQLTVTSRRRELLVQLAQVPGTIEWMVLALEGPSAAAAAPGEDPGAQAEQVLSQVLDDHGHKIVGRERGMAAAILAAESYAAEWQRGQREGSRIEECPCEEIGAG